jgi:conjugal transfer pilus assembly protein TraF
VKEAAMRKTFLSLVLVALPATALSDAGSSIESPSTAATLTLNAKFWEEHRRGWHFYDDPPPEPPSPRPSRPPQAPANPADPRPPELLTFERLQKRLEEYRNIAIVSPTESNVRRYMELEAKVVRQASLFSDVAQRVAWATPDLDMTLQGRPVNARAIEVFDREQASGRQQTVVALAKTHVLFFFFRSDCPYCHAFAPTLEALRDRYGMEIVPVSLDGRALPAFPHFRQDNGISRALNVSQVPAVYLAEPRTGSVTPLGFGILSEAQLLERITTLSASATEALTPSITQRISLK